MESSTCSESAETDGTDDEICAKRKRHSLPRRSGKQKQENIHHDSVDTTSPRPSTSHCNRETSTDRSKHTALRMRMEERQGRVKGNGKHLTAGKGKNVSWAEEDKVGQPEGSFTSITDVLGK